MLNDAVEHFTNYVLSLPDPMWIKALALLGLIWIIYAIKSFLVQLITIVFYIIAFIIWIINKLRTYGKSKIK